MTPPQPFPATK